MAGSKEEHNSPVCPLSALLYMDSSGGAWDSIVRSEVKDKIVLHFLIEKETESTLRSLART